MCFDHGGFMYEADGHLDFSICLLLCATMWTISWISATTDLPKPSKACSAHSSLQIPEIGARKHQLIKQARDPVQLPPE